MNNRLRIQILIKDGRQCLFAKRIGVDDSFVSKVINGYKKLAAEKRQEWAKALDCTVQEIFPE